MADRMTTSEEISKKATYQEAVPVPGGGQPPELSEVLHQRTVVTSMTHGLVTLRYAPHTPRAASPVDTAS